MNKNYPHKIKVSVVVPVYNVELYLRQCLDSLKSQTLKEIEFILINDLSTDNCGLICDEYALSDDRFIVIHNKTNIRQGLSRNKGIDIAKGEYIGFVDADDYIDPDYYEKLYAAAEINNFDISKTEAIKLYSDGRKIKQPYLKEAIMNGIKDETPLFLLFTYEHWTAIFKRDLLIKHNIKYPDIRNAQDNVFLLRVNYFAKSISLVSGTFYYYRQHSSSTISIKEEAFFNSILQSFELYVDFINTHDMAKKYYDLFFIKSFDKILIRYKEIANLSALEEYKREYVKKALIIMNQYKYDKEYLLECFVNGFNYGNITQQLKNSIAYRISRAITWLPSKIKKIMK